MTCRPVLAVSLATVSGVALGAWLPQEPAAWGWAAIAVMALWAALLAAGKLIAGTRAGLLFFVIAGIFRLQCDLAPLYAGGEPLEEGDAVARGRIARPAEVRDGETLIQLESVLLRRAGKTVRLVLPLQLVVPGDGGLRYALGDLVTARGRLRQIRGDRNLGWFPGPVTTAGRRCEARLVVSAPAWICTTGNDPGRGAAAAVCAGAPLRTRSGKPAPGLPGRSSTH